MQKWQKHILEKNYSRLIYAGYKSKKPYILEKNTDKHTKQKHILEIKSGSR